MADQQPLPSTSAGASATGAETKDVRPWRPFKCIDNVRNMPPAIAQLFEAMCDENGTMSEFQFVSFITNICMVETGFVPVRLNEEPDLSADDLLREPLVDRMNRFIDVLISIARERRILDAVEYKFVMVNLPAPGEQFRPAEYGPHSLAVCTWENSDIFVSCSYNHLETYYSVSHQTKFRSKYVVTGPHNMTRISQSNMMEWIRTANLIADIKTEICAHMVDKLECISFELTGLTQLPNEVILHLAKFLDLKSVVRLLCTSRRMKYLLDTEEIWLNVLETIQMDFLEYGLRPPSNLTLRAQLQDQTANSKQKSRRLFEDAIHERRTVREQQRLRWFNNRQRPSPTLHWFHQGVSPMNWRPSLNPDQHPGQVNWFGQRPFPEDRFPQRMLPPVYRVDQPPNRLVWVEQRPRPVLGLDQRGIQGPIQGFAQNPFANHNQALVEPHIPNLMHGYEPRPVLPEPIMNGFQLTPILPSPMHDIVQQPIIPNRILFDQRPNIPNPVNLFEHRPIIPNPINLFEQGPNIPNPINLFEQRAIGPNPINMFDPRSVQNPRNGYNRLPIQNPMNVNGYNQQVVQNPLNGNGHNQQLVQNPLNGNGNNHQLVQNPRNGNGHNQQLVQNPRNGHNQQLVRNPRNENGGYNERVPNRRNNGVHWFGFSNSARFGRRPRNP